MIIPKQILESNKVVEVLDSTQYQPCGIDMSLKEVYRFVDSGVIDFDNKERKISKVEAISFNNEFVELKAGAYKVMFNEYVRIPKDLAAICLPRSSMLRCGATLECALWDPGYEGRSEALLVVRNDFGIKLKKNAKIGQMVFIKLSESTHTLYEGTYKGENR